MSQVPSARHCQTARHRTRPAAPAGVPGPFLSGSPAQARGQALATEEDGERKGRTMHAPLNTAELCPHQLPCMMMRDTPGSSRPAASLRLRLRNGAREQGDSIGRKYSDSLPAGLYRGSMSCTRLLHTPRLFRPATTCPLRNAALSGRYPQERRLLRYVYADFKPAGFPPFSQVRHSRFTAGAFFFQENKNYVSLF